MVKEKELTKDEIKKELSQFNDIELEISELESKIKKFSKEANVVVSVDGSMKEYPYTKTHQKITAYNKKYINELNKYIDILKTRKLTLIKQKNKIEEYIATLPTSRLRLIFEYKYINHYSWNKIAYKLGTDTTAESARKEHDRFFKEN